MPRQIINDPQIIVQRLEPMPDSKSSEPLSLHSIRPYEPGYEPAKNERVVQENALHLVWNREAGWAQVGIEVDARDLCRIADALRAGDGGLQTNRFGFFVDLNERSELQMLVRTARRARDAIHGADE